MKFKKPKPTDWDYERPDEIRTRLTMMGIDPDGQSTKRGAEGLTNLEAAIRLQDLGHY